MALNPQLGWGWTHPDRGPAVTVLGRGGGEDFVA